MNAKLGGRGGGQEAKSKTAEMKFLRGVAGYTRKDQIRNFKLGRTEYF
jgi:hypothetical protein